MPITFKDDGTTVRPIIECNWCGNQIKDVEQGNVYWLHDKPSVLYFNHKHCASAHDRALTEAARARGAIVLSEHIEVFLALLLGNTGRPDAMPIVDKERLYETRGE